MKKTLLSLLFMTAFGTSQAANTIRIFSSNLGSGITNGSKSAIASGTVRLGYFPTGFDFTGNANNYAALDAAFVQVYSFSGNLRTQNTNGFFDIAPPLAGTTFDATASYEGVPYDSSAGSTAAVSGDVAGERIHVWVLNNTTASSATEQAIFSMDQTWPDKDEQFTDVTASIDSGVKGLIAHLGAISQGPDIGSGAPSHSTLNPLGSAIATRTAPSTTGNKVPRNTVVNFAVSITGTGPFDYKWRKDGLEIGGPGTTLNSNLTTNTFSIGTASFDEDGVYDCVVTNSLGDVESNDITLDVISVTPFITVPVEPKTVAVGEAIELSVEVESESTLTYQWSLNGKVIPAAANPSAITKNLTISSAKLTDGGSYVCTVGNSAVTTKATTTSNVVVADNTPKVVTLRNTVPSTTLRASYTGVPASFEWFKDGVTMNVTTPTLTIAPLVAVSVAPVYKCVVTGDDLVGKDSSSTTLNIYSSAPAFAVAPNPMPDGIVGGSYNYQIVASSDASKAPLSYDAVGLPPGLSINKATGAITGKPTTAVLVDKKITLKIINLAGPVTVDDFIKVAALPANIAGTYVGPVERIAKLGANIGGRLDNLIVAPTGAITGNLILGTVRYSVVGAVSVSGIDPLTATVSASAVIKRTAPLLPLTLNFDLGANLLTEGDLTDGTDHVYVEGWRNKWAASPVVANATNYAARYHLAIAIPDETAPSTPNPAKSDLTLPQGAGYASFTVAKDGRFTFTGKLPDGEGITGGTFVGPTGQIFMFQSLYTTALKGSLLGKFVIDDKATTAVTDNEIAGDADWSRPANLAASNRLYRDGFGPFDLTIVGGQYTPPVAPTLLLGLTTGTANAALSFEQGGIAAADRNPNSDVSVTTGNKAAIVGTNTALVKLTPVAATGLFSGSFELKDENPTTALVNADELKRVPTFQGLIVPIKGSLTGVGYFLLDQIPSSTPPATTAANSPRLSGGAYFEVK